MKKPNIKPLSQVLQTGLGLFLVTGLTGCTDNECDDLKYAPQFKIDECKKKTSIHSSGGSSTHSSGFFAPVGSNTYHSSGG